MGFGSGARRGRDFGVGEDDGKRPQDPMDLSSYSAVPIFLGFGIVFVAFNYFLNSLITREVAEPQKYDSYECGEVPEGSAQIQYGGLPFHPQGLWFDIGRNTLNLCLFVIQSFFHFLL